MPERENGRGGEDHCERVGDILAEQSGLLRAHRQYLAERESATTPLCFYDLPLPVLPLFSGRYDPQIDDIALVYRSELILSPNIPA